MHGHDFREVVSLDGGGYEKVCSCGAVQPSDLDVVDKVSGCMDLEKYMNVTYGPPTNVSLEGFLLPTLTKIKCRDKFVDAKPLAKLRVYTAIIRLCEQRNIPRVYADEAMRQLLKSGKGVHSKYDYIFHLINVLTAEPRLHNRIPDLRSLLGKEVTRFFKDAGGAQKNRSGTRRKPALSA